MKTKTLIDFGIVESLESVLEGNSLTSVLLGLRQIAVVTMVRNPYHRAALRGINQKLKEAIALSREI